MANLKTNLRNTNFEKEKQQQKLSNRISTIVNRDKNLDIFDYNQADLVTIDKAATKKLTEIVSTMSMAPVRKRDKNNMFELINDSHRNL